MQLVPQYAMFFMLAQLSTGQFFMATISSDTTFPAPHPLHTPPLIKGHVLQHRPHAPTILMLGVPVEFSLHELIVLSTPAAAAMPALFFMKLRLDSVIRNLLLR